MTTSANPNAFALELADGPGLGHALTLTGKRRWLRGAAGTCSSGAYDPDRERLANRPGVDYA